MGRRRHGLCREHTCQEIPELRTGTECAVERHTVTMLCQHSEGTELLSGTTDQNGEFSFKVPQKAELKIVLEAGAGHRAEWTIAADEIEMPAAGKKPVLEEGATVKGLIIGLGLIFGLTALGIYVRKHKKKKIADESTQI